MKIQIKKGDTCPICIRKIVLPNCWVPFHVKYSPELVVIACRYCNFVEYCLRNKHSFVPFNGRDKIGRISRSERVIQFMGKFDIKL